MGSPPLPGNSRLPSRTTRKTSQTSLPTCCASPRRPMGADDRRGSPSGKKRFNPASWSLSMDKSMIPIIVALVAVAAAGVAIAIYWEAPGGGNDAPPGYLTSEPGYNASPVNPDGPEPSPVGPDMPAEPDGGLLKINEGDLVMELTSAGFISANRASEWTVSDNTVCSVLPHPDGLRCTLTALKAGTCTLTATCGEESASCVITVKESGADVQSVSGPPQRWSSTWSWRRVARGP